MKKNLNESWCFQSIQKLSFIKQLALIFMIVALVGNYNQAVAFDSDGTESAQQQKQVTGTVVDSDGNPMPGVTVLVKGTTTGAVTDIDGNYTVQVPDDNAVLVFSFVGMSSQEIPVAGQTTISVTLESDTELLEDVVVVGYGVQKKESVVGAITRATGDELQQAGGVVNVGEALQGRLPGVTTILSSGLPGQTDPQIYIRGQSSWNGSGQPLILVDGVERGMGDIDLNEIDQISVLKDASATAVFGVKGANGVILLTTKRGTTGKAKLSLSANTTLKTVSKLPKQLESYGSVLQANEAIMKEVMYSPSSWDDIIPIEIAEKYRNPASIEESYIYPNVDWQDMILKDFATDSRINLSVRGGSDFTKYFGSLSFQSTRDIFKGSEYDNGKGYGGEYKYDRFNYRSNLDFNITNSTTFSVNLSGYFGIQEKPSNDLRTVINSIYELASSAYYPVFPDGYYGMHPSDDFGLVNPIVILTNTGFDTYNRLQVNSDFELVQKLDFITEGLKLKGKLSYDNNMTARQQLRDPGMQNLENVIYRMYDMEGNEIIHSAEGINDFDFVVQPWFLNSNNIQDGSRMRRLNYELSLNYQKIFAKKHNTSALFLFKREEYAIGNMFPRYREDWVSRVTYNYDSRYFIDVNGAYNGSEKFGAGYRFELFPSAALGWVISNEAFMDDLNWLDKLKLRGSYGLVGDDNFSGRWKYMTQWGSGGYADLVPGNFGGSSPYVWYSEDVVGNPNLHWETAVKSNIGFELSILENKFTADVDYFMEDRDDILIPGSQRSVPDFYGTAPPDANSGKVEVRGYEVVLGANHKFGNGMDLWTNFSFTDAKDEVLYREDPALRPFYQKAEGYPIGQPRAAVPGDIMTSWDDIYMSTPTSSNQNFRRPGYYDLVDFDSDGMYNSSYDNPPYGYPSRPQQTWTWSTGAGYKGLNLMVMFYGARNASRVYDTRIFTKETYLYYEHAVDYWSPDNQDATKTQERWTLSQATDDPLRNWYDASVVRLKTVELSYNIPKKACEKLGVDALKLFVNGHNLYLWTTMPDDREYNGTNTQESQYRGDYPTMKRFNFGLNLNF
ncbi:MAG: TonB-dependent receptor [Draconibacterium sp.]|nr:TonB-dependent receptor [Draconibacterium sp.]